MRRWLAAPRHDRCSRTLSADRIRDGLNSAWNGNHRDLPYVRTH
jgi:hypothetical protein